MTFLSIHGCKIDLAASRIKGANDWIQLKPKSMGVLEYLPENGQVKFFVQTSCELAPLYTVLQASVGVFYAP
jgi:hypothetical protein